MDRLTMRINGVAALASEYEEKYTPAELIDVLLARLADYEDSKLSPEEVNDMAENAETRLLTTTMQGSPRL